MRLANGDGNDGNSVHNVRSEAEHKQRMHRCHNKPCNVVAYVPPVLRQMVRS